MLRPDGAMSCDDTQVSAQLKVGSSAQKHATRTIFQSRSLACSDLFFLMTVKP